jgi:outer membrane protein assembly factor BamB
MDKRFTLRRQLFMKRKLLRLSLCLLLASCGGSHPNAPLLSVPPSAAAEDYVYIADAAGRIRAIRPDGKEQWAYTLADDLRRQDSAASYDLQITYLTARANGKLFGLATELTGRYAGEIILFALDGNRLLWQTSAPAPEPAVVPIAIGQTALYEAGDDGVLYAFARTDGHRLWQYRVSQGTLGTPTIGADGTIYVTGPRHNLHAIAPDGSERWVLQTDQ